MTTQSQPYYGIWRKRDLSGRRYVYIWADGVYFTPRLDGDRQCMLVIIGADEYGEKDVLAIMDGFRENADSWRDLLKGLKKRGLAVPPELATGDGALGFWAALRDVFPETREQRCWVHKTANVLGALPKSLHEKAKSDLQDIWMAETKKEANAAFDLFVETYRVKYEKAVAKLVKDRDELLAFYDFPAEHSHPDYQPDRERLWHGPEPHPENQGLPQPQNRPRHGFQADDVSKEEVAEDFRAEPPARGRSGG